MGEETDKEIIEIESVENIQIENVEMIHLDPRVSDEEWIQTTNEQYDSSSSESIVDDDGVDGNMQSISSAMAFGYILPPQILIGLIAFYFAEYENVMYNADSEQYKSARNIWFWGSRVIQNSVFVFIYWAEIHLVGQFSAVYMMVFGGVRNICTLLLSFLILDYKLNAYGWMGYAIAIAAVSAFQYSK